MRGIPSGRGWAHLARSGIQSEHRIHFILPTGAASYMIKWLTELDIYWPIISYPISRSQVSTCCFFPRKSPIELLRYSIQRMMVSWWSNKPFILCIFVSVFLSLVLGLWYRPQRPISFLPFLKAVRRMKPSPSHAVYSMVPSQTNIHFFSDAVNRGRI